MNPLFKYPRTPHIKGSGLQSGDEDLKTVSLNDLKASHLIVERKNGWSQLRNLFYAQRGASVTKSGTLSDRWTPGTAISTV